MTAAAPAQTTVARPSPYQGLVPYSEADAEWFFGREEWSAVVADNLRAYRATVLYGASGVGKSSLLHAGMIRMLNDEAREHIAEHGAPRLLPVAFSDWSLDQPLTAFTAAVSDAAEAVLPDGASLSRDCPLAQLLEEVPARLGGPLLLVLDQLEELFVYHGGADDATLRELTAVLGRRDPAVHFLLSIREDALAGLDRLQGQVPGLGDHLLRLEHLDRDAGREAITAPLELWNAEIAEPGREVEIEPELAEAILDQVAAGQVSLGAARLAASNGNREAGIETPYLQLVLIRLWDEEWRAGSRRLRLATLERLGGAGRIVRTHLDNALAALPPAEQDLAGRTFRYLVTPSGTKIALRVSDLADYASVPAEELQPLIDELAGRVRVLRSAGDGRFEIYHDALAGPILDWRGRWEERQRRRRERRRLLVFGAASVALLAVVVAVSLLAVWALSQRRSAHRKELSATALALTSLANLQSDGRPDVALLLAREAFQINPNPDTRASLLTTFEKIRQARALAVLRADSHGVHSVALSPDGRTLATAGSWLGARLWDIRTGRRLPLRGKTTYVQSVAFSSDGRLLAGGTSFMVRLWDVRSGRQLQPLPGPKAGVPAVAFSPDGHTLAAASTDGVRLWDVRTHRGRGRLLPHSLDVWSLAFSPDGRLLASGGYDRTVRLWNVATRKQAGRPLRHRGEVTGVAFSPDGSLLASSGQTIPASSHPTKPAIVDHTVRLWDVRSHQELGAPLPHASSVTSVAFSSDGTLASGSADGTIRLWDVHRHEPLGSPLLGQEAAVASLAFSADGKTLASGGGYSSENRAADPIVRIWELGQGSGLGQVLHGHKGSVYTVVFSPDGRTLASGGSDETGLMWDSRSGKPISRASHLGGSVDSLAYSPDGKTLAAGVDVRGLLLFDLRTGKQIGHPLPSYSVYSAAFSPDGLLLATGDGDGIRLWNVRTRRQRGPVMRHRDTDGHSASVRGVAFSPDGQTLASAGGDGVVRFWDVRSQKQLGRSVRHPRDYVLSGVAFSPDGRTVASVGGADQTVRFWDVASHRESGSPLQAYADLNAVAFSPDGRTLATGGADAVVRLWDVRARRQLGPPLHGHSDDIYALAFSPDGRTLASASGDGTVLLWKGFLFGADDSAYLDRQVCGFAGGNLTRAEWADLVPGIPYRGTCP
jgi:WD40 repeat protein